MMKPLDKTKWAFFSGILFVAASGVGCSSPEETGQSAEAGSDMRRARSSSCDGDLDGDVDFADFTRMSGNFNRVINENPNSHPYCNVDADCLAGTCILFEGECSGSDCRWNGYCSETTECGFVPLENPIESKECGPTAFCNPFGRCVNQMFPYYGTNEGDCNSDGTVDFRDFLTLSADWTGTCDEASIVGQWSGDFESGEVITMTFAADGSATYAIEDGPEVSFRFQQVPTRNTPGNLLRGHYLSTSFGCDGQDTGQFLNPAIRFWMWWGPDCNSVNFSLDGGCVTQLRQWAGSHLDRI